MMALVPSGLQERCAQHCTCLPAFEVELNFGAVGSPNATEAAREVVQQLRTNADTPVLVTVTWTDCSGAHSRMVVVSGNRARALEPDEPIPVQ